MENIKDKKLGNNNFKNFITCNTNTSGGSPSDDKCNNIGPEYAHIGNFCIDSSNNKIPMKQILYAILIHLLVLIGVSI